MQVISYYVTDVLTWPGVPGLFIAAVVAATFRLAMFTFTVALNTNRNGTHELISNSSYCPSRKA